ncbi:MAG: glycoside hydrolase family 92 protein [Bacteroides sp.]|nr:glycoside hydrolase family 92 protein [Bacteroides sp.]
MERLVLTACFICLVHILSTAQDPVDYIDPMIGTVSDHSNEGKNFPGATTPFGLVQLSPDTRVDNDVASGYSYTHESIEGFSFLHLSGVGCFGEFGNLLVTPRSGILKFTFPESDSSRIQVDLAHRMSGKSVRQYVEVIGDRTIRGWMYCDTRGGGLVCCTENLKYTVYFYLQFSKPFKSHGIWSADVPESISYESRKKTEDFSFRDLYLSPVYSKDYQQLVRESKIYKDTGCFEGDHVGFFAEYETGLNEEILVKSGISFVSMEGAQKNLEKELEHWDFPVEEAFQLCVENALGSRSIRVKKEEFTLFGYVPCDVDETSITKTLEYCYADWCVAQFARELGRQELYEQFTEHSKGYRHIYSAEAGFMRGRKKDGGWAEWNGKFSYGRKGNVQEANIFNQHWFVPHDVEGLITLMGKKRFITQLDSLFIMAPENFGHNEKGFGISFEHVHHVPYLFNIEGAPWLTQKWSRAIVDRAYGADPWGIPGNEDAGQMSAWYVLSAMGFHPVAPGNNRYQLGSPSFDKVTLKLNGKTLSRTWITHDEITAGGILEFIMGPYPALNYFDVSATTQLYNP